jgi:hypothetical protein
VQIIGLPTKQIGYCGTARCAWERGKLFVASVGKYSKEEQLPRKRVAIGKGWGYRANHMRMASPWFRYDGGWKGCGVEEDV